MITAQSAEWPSEKAWLEQQISILQRTLESPELSETQTAIIRGEIGAWRKRITVAENKQTERPENAPAPTPTY